MLTGAVNMVCCTLRQSDAVAVAILLDYMATLTIVGVALFLLNVTLRL